MPAERYTVRVSKDYLVFCAGPVGALPTQAGEALAAKGALGSLQIARPTAAPGLYSEHIIIVQPDHRMSFYAGSRWVRGAA